LAGGRALPSPFGVFYSPNITQSKRYGIGNWSSSDFLRAVRSGIGPKHKLYYPVFPFTGYSKMTDSDINAVYAYLKTFKAVDIPNIKHRLHFPYSQRKLLEVWRAAYFRKEEGEPSLKRIRMGQGAFVPLPSHDADWNRGAYLVEGPLHCAVCHTPRDVLGGPKLQLWMAGSTTSGDPKRAAPDITPTLHTSVGNWSASDWIVFLNTAQMPNGSFVGGEMKDVIRGATSVLTDDDKLAVARYLHSLEPVENEKLAETIRAQKDARSEGK
jgi:mono/diheme cytochrome c family protein